MSLMTKYIAAWFPMIFIASANGAFREFVLRQYMNELPAHQISTIMLILLFTMYFWLLMLKFGLESEQQALHIGILWCLMTLIFEFGIGHFISGHSWMRLLAEYNLLAGRLWVLIPVWIIIAPFVLYRLRNS